MILDSSLFVLDLSPAVAVAIICGAVAVSVAKSFRGRR